VESRSLPDLPQYHRVSLDVFEKFCAYHGIVVARREEVRLKSVLLDERKAGISLLRVLDPLLAEIEADVFAPHLVPYQASELPRTTPHFQYGSSSSRLDSIRDHRPQEIIFRRGVMAGPVSRCVERGVVPLGASLTMLLRRTARSAFRRDHGIRTAQE